MSYYNDPINIINTSQSIGIGSGGSFTVDGGASIGKTLYVGKDLHVSGTTASFADNLLVVNSNPTHTVDTGILFKRYSNDVSNNNNYSSIVYSEQQDRFILGYLQDDPGNSTSNISSLIGLQTSEITSSNILTTNISTSKLYVNGNEITGSGDSNWTKIGSDLSYTSGSVSIGSLRSDNISTGTIFATTQISGANVYANTVTTATLLVDTQISSANLNAGVISAGTILSTTQISGANVYANSISTGIIISNTYTGGNIQISGNASIGILAASTVTSASISALNISCGTVRVSNQILAPSGTATTAGISFNNDPDTGLFSPAGNTIALTTNGTERIRITNSGNVGIGTTNPSSSLHLSTNSDTILNMTCNASNDNTFIFNSSTNIRYSDLYFSPNGSLNYRVKGDGSYPSRFLITSSGSVIVSNNLNFPLGNGINFNVGSAASQNRGEYSLHAVSGGTFPIRLCGSDDGGTQRPFQIGYYTGNNSNSTWNVRFHVNTYSGNTGIGRDNPQYLLHLNTDSAGKPNGGSWANSSDQRLKENIELADLDICWNIVKNLPLKRYRWKDNSYTEEQIKDRNVIGWIAQDVASVFPKAVNSGKFTNIDGTVIDDCLNLNETMIIRTLYGATQKIMSELENTKSELQTANEKITSLINFIQSKYPNDEFEL